VVETSVTPPPLPSPPHKKAAEALICAAIFSGLFLAFFFSVLLKSPSGLDAFSLTFLCACGLVFVCSTTAATLLLLKKKSGIIFYWICSPILIFSIPIGTIIVLYVAIQLGTPEARKTLT